MPMRTVLMIFRMTQPARLRTVLRMPGRVVEPVPFQDVTPRTGVDIRPPCSFVRCDDAVPHLVGLLPGVGKRVGAALKDRATHRPCIEQREPLAVEAAARDLSPVARRFKTPPVV